MINCICSLSRLITQLAKIKTGHLKFHHQCLTLMRRVQKVPVVSNPGVDGFNQSSDPFL